MADGSGPGAEATARGEAVVLGCGGSLGVPLVGGFWGDCDPNEPRNRRTRPSILLRTDQAAFLIDTTPDCRTQLLANAVTRLDAVLYTHTHADHTHGIDDVRTFAWRNKAPLPCYATPDSLADLERRFGYALDSVTMDRKIYGPILSPVPVLLTEDRADLTIAGMPVTVFRQDHGICDSLGVRIGDFAYSTDVVALSEPVFDLLEGVRTWVVDANRREPHKSHAHLERTLDWIGRVAPERAFLTHMNHAMDYRTLTEELPPHVAPAHDGLVLDFAFAPVAAPANP